MLKGALNVIVIIIFIFIFLVWFLDLTASNQTEGNLIKMLEGAVIEAGKSFKEFKDNINLFRGEKSFVPFRAIK